MKIPSDISISDIGAFIAIIMSALSLYQNHLFNKRQSKFEKRNAELSELLIEKETGEIQDQKKADLSANFVKIGKHYKLKVFNKGKSPAKNVRLEILDNAGLIQENDVARKFPAPRMEQYDFIELLVYVHFGSPSRTHLKVIWDDESGVNIEKELFPTL